MVSQLLANGLALAWDLVACQLLANGLALAWDLVANGLAMLWLMLDCVCGALTLPWYCFGIGV